MARAWLVAMAFVVSVAVWVLAEPLAWPARACTVLIVGLLPAGALGQMDLTEEIPAEVPRRAFYLSSAIALWALAALAVFAALASGYSPSDLGLQSTDTAAETLLWAGGLTGAGVGALFVFRALGARETPILRYLLPKTTPEKAWFAGLSITAGVAEELVFRGYLILVLEIVTGSIWFAAILSSMLFGILHGYQGTSGIARTGILGFFLALPLVMTGSILPAMIAHSLINLLAGIWLADRLVAP